MIWTQQQLYDTYQNQKYIYTHIIIYNLPSFNISLSSLIQMKKNWAKNPQKIRRPARGFRCAWASVVIWVPISDPFFRWKKGTQPWNTRACKRNDMWNLICGNFNMTYEYIYILYILYIYIYYMNDRTSKSQWINCQIGTFLSHNRIRQQWFGPLILGSRYTWIWRSAQSTNI